MQNTPLFFVENRRDYRNVIDKCYHTCLLYTSCVFLSVAMPLLQEIPEHHPKYSYAQDLIKGLRAFVPIDSEKVPSQSLLREFIGKE